MGRKEESIKTDHKAIAELAGSLRQLREDAGGPTYRSMAARAHYAASTLSRAAAGRGLPSLDVVQAYVAACGGDQTEWTRRWEQIHAAVQPPPQIVARPVQETPVSHFRSPSRRSSGRAEMAALLGAALLAVGAVMMVLSAQRKPQRSPLCQTHVKHDELVNIRA